MALHEFMTEDGKIERVLILGSENMSPGQLQEMLEWSRRNSKKQELERKQRARYRKIPAIEAYREMRRFKDWVSGRGKVF
jgi:ribosomal protein S18